MKRFLETKPVTKDTISLLQDASTQSQFVWKEDSLTLTDISIANNAHRQISNSKLRGWRTVDGKKMYQTFRDGKLVKSDGAEAFRLALGDGAIPKKSKEHSNSITKTHQSSLNSTDENISPSIVECGSETENRPKKRKPTKLADPSLSHSQKSTSKSAEADQSILSLLPTSTLKPSNSFSCPNPSTFTSWENSNHPQRSSFY